MKTLGTLRITRTSVVSAVLVTLFFWHFLTNTQTQVPTADMSPYTKLSMEHHQTGTTTNNNNAAAAAAAAAVVVDTPFMPKMANETLKAELGNAAWKLLHTILARYPEQPNQKERLHLEQYIWSFAQVYPCGDCARHFILLLEKYPPQTNSRKNAAMWGCFIHNQVNRRLGKPDYDCSTVLEDYDCGCGNDEQLEDDTRHHVDSIVVESRERDVE